MKYLDLTGLQKFWTKVKNHVQTSLQGYAKTSDIPDTSKFLAKKDNGYVEIDTPFLGIKTESFSLLDDSYMGINSYGGGEFDIEGNHVVIMGLRYITAPESRDSETLSQGQSGQVLMSNGEGVHWGDIPSGGGTSSGSTNSIPFTYFTCYSPSRTVRELIDQLANEDVDTTNSITVIVSFSAMLGGTFLCNLNNYYGDYYGCEFTDLTNLKTYYFEGESRSLSLYDNLSNGGTSSGGAGLSMPRIRLSNWEYITPATRSFDESDTEIWNGEIKFSVCIQDGTVQEGDEIEICGLRKTFGKYKLRRFCDRPITAEDIDNLAKQPYLQITTDNMRDIYRTDSNDPGKAKPKFIRIRRPIWGENKHGEWVEVNALFSNVIPVHIGLRFDDI